MPFVVKQYETLINEKAKQGLKYNIILDLIENDLGIKNVIPYHTFYRAVKRNSKKQNDNTKIEEIQQNVERIEDLNLNITGIANNKNNIFE